MKYAKFVQTPSSLLDFLSSHDPFALDRGLIWRNTPQGEDYWWSIYMNLSNRKNPPNLEEAKNYIRGFLGLPTRILEEEAEWE